MKSFFIHKINNNNNNNNKDQYMGSQVWPINRIVDLLNLLIVRCLIMQFRNPSVPSRMDIKHSLSV
jgi:hypothetical protein